ncbi:hypothetical protein NP233_g4908 [Leucocoprinus birnbaumii]|uniref:Uncharacterized protein n=1 Tax=Leucocoprinus birnbaumii TaxID=56174 RepID=A0AAD5YWV8_9AGAR|nr:hypothetical protein NP233_g4908 [Leucocoprinus birnbaumii]
MSTTARPVNLGLVFVGDMSVGKTSLLSRLLYTEQPWERRRSATVGADFQVTITFNMTMTVTAHKISIVPEPQQQETHGVFKDTGGQERFRSIVPQYYRGAHGVILVYDVTKRATFDGLSWWYSDLSNHVSDSVVKILVGNKIDEANAHIEDSRQVSTSEGQQLATRMNSLFIETSAKDVIGVTEVFTNVVEKIMDIPEVWVQLAGEQATGGGNENATTTVVNEGMQPIRVDDSPPPRAGGGCAC